MTERAFAWLHGASRGQQCPVCGDRVWVHPNADDMYLHSVYYCAGAPKSKALARIVISDQGSL